MRVQFVATVIPGVTLIPVSVFGWMCAALTAPEWGLCRLTDRTGKSVTENFQQE
jgi:hypothetical protein